jgi:hypothetical protein
MHKNPAKHYYTKEFLAFAIKTKSWHPVIRNGWIIKFSIYDGSNILINIISQHTGQAIIRYFTSEDTACSFINFVLNMDAEQVIEL